MNDRSRHLWGKKHVLLAAVPAVLLAVSAGAAPSGDREANVDTMCPWGRLSDGKGRLLRCLSRDEAAKLREPSPAQGGAEPPRVEAPAPAVPSAAPAEPVPPPAPSKPPADAEKAPEVAYAVEIAPVVADEGTLPDALKGLKKGGDRYAECVEKNGGLSDERADIELRFLVQGRGRAEGVSVKKRRGVSEPAAKCIAGVVDRRFVGYPDGPAVGATVSFTVTKKKR